jgi:hypothetical protein
MMRVVIRIVLAAMASLLLATEGWTQPLALSYPSPTYNNVNIFGNATIGGALGISGAATFSGGMAGTLTGHATLDLPLTGGNVSGDSTFSGSGTGLTVTNNTTIGGTLGVTGALTLAHDPNTINVRDYGAVGDGATSDTAAVQAAATACPSAGCTLYFPPGYVFGWSGTVYLKSNTHVVGYGATLLAVSTVANFIQNVNHTATVLTDSNITVEGLTFDYGSTGGGLHAVEMDFVTHSQVLNSIGFGHGSANDLVAGVGVSDMLVQGNSATGFNNTSYDFWWGPTNVRLIGNFATSASSAQMVNFNPDPTTGPTTGLVADGFVMAGNTFIGTGSVAIPIIVGPQGSGMTMVNAAITGNTFKNVSLVVRGASQGATISGNVFDGLLGGVTNIVSSPMFGGVPDSIAITGNTIIKPTTTSGNEAVIQAAGTNMTVTGNTISGTPGACYAATYSSTYPVVIGGNNGWSNCTYGNTGSAWVVDGSQPQAGAGTSFLLTRGTITAAGFPNALQMVFSEARNPDGTAMATTPSAGKFGLNWGPGQNQLLHSETANSSTITDTAAWEFTLPASYIPGSSITLTSWCYYVLGSGTVGTHTLEMDAYSIGGSSGIGGGLSSNLIATAPQTVPTTPANLTFTITGTGLYPGERVLLVSTMVLQATTAQNILGYIFSAQMQ